MSSRLMHSKEEQRWLWMQSEWWSWIMDWRTVVHFGMVLSVKLTINPLKVFTTPKIHYLFLFAYELKWSTLLHKLPAHRIVWLLKGTAAVIWRCLLPVHLPHFFCNWGLNWKHYSQLSPLQTRHPLPTCRPLWSSCQGLLHVLQSLNLNLMSYSP